jgi:hypothetical protein
MRFAIIAALALAVPTSLRAQTAAPAPAVDLSYATPLPGSWGYAAISGGSEATFRDSAGRAQLTIRCTRSARHVSIAKPASAAAPSLHVWTSSATRNLPASFDPATGQISAVLAAFDPLLDAMTFSRGRFAVSVAGAAALVVPPWGEVSRVIEDCRT